MQELVMGVWVAVKVWLCKLSSLMIKKLSISSNDEAILKALEEPFINHPKRRPRLIFWNKSIRGWIKLNVDGCCHGNLGNCGDGGILQDHGGNFISAFSTYFGHGTNNEAEL